MTLHMVILHSFDGRLSHIVITVSQLIVHRLINTTLRSFNFINGATSLTLCRNNLITTLLWHLFHIKTLFFLWRSPLHGSRALLKRCFNVLGSRDDQTQLSTSFDVALNCSAFFIFMDWITNNWSHRCKILMEYTFISIGNLIFTLQFHGIIMSFWLGLLSNVRLLIIHI